MLISFASPWILAALAGLPVLFWLLRATPPAPRRVRFPAIRLLLGLTSPEETPARTPLWLVLLRLFLASLLILGFADPLLDAPAGFPRTGPLVLVADNGWASARDWPARLRAIGALLDQAERERRQVVLLETAPPPGAIPPPPLSLLRPADARAEAERLVPRPWLPDHAAALKRLAALKLSNSANVVWLSDGVDSAQTSAFAKELERMGGLRVLVPARQRLPHLLTPVPGTSTDLAFAVLRPAAFADTAPVFLRLLGDDGRLLGRAQAGFTPDTAKAEIRFDLPAEMRNRAVRAEIEGEGDAGGVLLLDERWRRRPVGIAATGAEGSAQPLLSGTYYIEKALLPFAEIRRGSIGDLLKRELAMLVLTGPAPAVGEERAALVKWMEQGGVVLRFAGSGMGEAIAGEAITGKAGDDLLPVRLRQGGRTIGGAFSWGQPAHLAPFPDASPFAGLPIPEEVSVTRQVLAEPTMDLGGKTWAQLADGTPLITAERRGRGVLVLIHTSGSPEWSNLALSGLFVQMLRRIAATGEGVSGRAEGSLAPLETLDGFGRLDRAPDSVLPLPAQETTPSALHPPGYYGSPDSKRALNLHAAIQDFRVMEELPPAVVPEGYALDAATDLKPPLLAGAFLLLLADAVIALALRGLIVMPIMLLVLLSALPVQAQSSDAFVRKATAEFHLAYIRTGIPEIDDLARAGLAGLSAVLNQRTTVEVAEPMEIDPETDELAFFPLLYWPVAIGQAVPSPKAVLALNRYLASGGTIFFDTRDQTGEAALPKRLLAGIAMPPLAPLPPDHVLARSFYLLREFPGRWSGGQLWAEPARDRINDGVASVIVGANDWAGAWARDDADHPALPVVPGGERQRELAYRFGVNLVMYVLTGNYKSDQVHVPAILERLGQERSGQERLGK